MNNMMYSGGLIGLNDQELESIKGGVTPVEVALVAAGIALLSSPPGQFAFGFAVGFVQGVF